ncbi:hypothetical protein D9758_014566 [Tetrapyrgos nigripes]|uniref:DUF4203 domain-containing protein n=1 Tax=Tetrapyrgos nigripes TaxID=182062 RepID=A0A8H5CEX2_9AGAR|nr:hypothetical protein D9758_014566 [Tetrapyrgos nigripes]
MATTLTTLLPSNSFLLAYSLPLFFSSLVLTFAGAFLTLDRTRSFAPRYDAIPGSFVTPTKRKFQFVLEGGIGGLLIGYSFGLHLSTFLALLIPNKNPNLSSLSEKSFLATWLLSSLLTTFLGGRYKYAALALAGLTGGVAFSLSLCVIIHPSFLTRIVFTCVITPILTVLALLPLQRFQRPSLRMAASSIGAFGLVVSIALLSKIPSWANVWSRYWLKASEEWGGAKERGLSAGFCLFLLAGVGSDWLLSRFVGECPDEKWDTYLANYTSNLPNRAGTFKPFESFWDRWFSSKPKTPLSGDLEFDRDKDILFPEDPKSPRHHKHQLGPGFPGSRSQSSNSNPKPWSSTRFSNNSNSWSGAFSATSTIVEDEETSDFEKLKPKDSEKDILDNIPSLGYAPWSTRSPPAFLSKSHSKSKAQAKGGKKSKKARKREAIKFGGDYSSSEDGSGSDSDEYPLKKHPRPMAQQSPSMASMTTLVGAPPSPSPSPNLNSPFSNSPFTPGLGKALGKKQSMGFQPRPRDDISLKEEIDYEKEVEKLRGYKRRSQASSSPRSTSRDKEVPEYSDYESDITSLRQDRERRDEKEWTPAFLKAQRQQSASGVSGLSGGSGASQASGSTLVSSAPTTFSGSLLPLGTSPAGMGIVPATPSLIRALDRVAMAQKDAYPSVSVAPASLPRVEEEDKHKHAETTPTRVHRDQDQEEDTRTKKERKQEPGHGWENFWRDVKDKAQAHS